MSDEGRPLTAAELRGLVSMVHPETPLPPGFGLQINGIPVDVGTFGELLQNLSTIPDDEPVTATSVGSLSECPQNEQ